MKLKVFGSSSAGNSYLLFNESESLMIECGIKFKEVKKFLDFDISTIKGCLVSHSHGDHAKNVSEITSAGIQVFTQKETSDTFKFKSHRITNIKPGESFQVGPFQILPFDVKHDVPCLGFLIKHKETGTVLFLTDTYYSEYIFPGLNNVIIEANYSKAIVEQKQNDAVYLRDRIFQSHMSLETCCELLKANDLTKVNNIVLIHLSDRNSHEAQFVDQVQKLTGKTVHAATKELEIDFNLTPF